MFHDGVITMDGLELDTKIRAGLATAVFTSIKFGDGLYDGTEDLSQCSGMKSVRQSFGISSICVIDKKQVRLRTVTDNTGIEEGYYISELGVYAEDPDKGEILYSLSLGVPQKMDYQPSETELAGATGTFDVYTDVSNVEEATVAVGTGAAASAEDLDETNTRVDGLMNPEFEDYSGEGAEVPDAREAIANIRSKKGFTGIMSNIKAALMGLVTLGDIRGMLVNNGLCSEAGKFFLDAAYGKNLQDQLTKLNSDQDALSSQLEKHWGLTGGTPIPNGADLKTSEYLIPGNYCSGNNESVATLKNCPVNSAFVLRVDHSVEGGAYPRQTFITYKNEWIARTYSTSSGKWFEDCSYALKSDLALLNAIYYNETNGNSASALETKNSDGTKYRLQLSQSGNVNIYKYTNGTWTIIKNLI